MRRLGRIVLVLLVLIVGVAGYFALTFDPASYKPQIVAAVKQATGRDLQIKGGIRLAWSLSPTIEVSDVTLSNPAGFSRPDMATFGKMDLRLALMPLLGKRVEIDLLTLSKPDVRLETDAKGKGNWVFVPVTAALVPAASGVGTAAGGRSAPLTVAIKDVRIDGGVFTYRDGRTGQIDTLTLKQVAMQLGTLDTPVHMTAALVLDGTDVALTADTGPLGHLTGAIRGIWTVRLTATLGKAKIGIDGGIGDPLAGKGLDLAITADVPDLAALGATMKQSLPPLKAVVLRALLSGEPRKLVLRDMKVASSAGDLAGDLTVAMGLPMRIVGTLKSDKLNLDDVMGPTTAAAAKPVPGPAGPTEPAAPKVKRLIPDEKLPFGQLQMQDADLRLTVGALHLGGSDYKAIQAHVLLKDGVLTLDPASADLPLGHVAMTLSADAGKTEPPVHLTLKAPGIALAPLLASLGQPAYATGNLDVTADLRGAGESLHAIASSLGGTLVLIVPGGTIDIKRIGGSAASVMQSLNPAKAGSGSSALRCFVLRLDFAHGIGTARPLTLGSAALNVDGEGAVNLGDETLALALRSRTSIAGAAISVPVSVSGPIMAPQTKVNEIGIVQGNAAVLGGLLGGSAIGGGQQRPPVGDSCPAAIAMARGQAAPASAPGPARTPAKPPNAGQLLKQLFH